VVRPFVCTAFAALLIAACGRSPADRAAAPSPTAAPATLTIAYADPRARNPAARGIDTIASLLGDERLVVMSREGRPQARLAERWEVSADGRSWHFFLRPGLTFHDGQPLDAASVKASLASALGNPAALEAGMRDVEAIETPSPGEVVLRLRRPNAFVPESLSLLEVRSAKDAFAGPFRLETRTTGRATLAGVRDYYGGAPALARIAIVEFPTPREAWSAMLRGEVDLLWDVAPEALEFVRESPNARVTSFLRPYVATLAFNVKHPVLGRREVRRALNVAIDREQVIASTAGGRGLPASDHLWLKHWARDPAAPAFAFDPAAARAALDGAGLPRTSAAPRTRFSFTCLVPTDPRYERLALLLQRELLDIDVDMRLEAVPLSEFGTRVGSGRFDAFLYEVISGRGPGVTYALWHSTPPGPLFHTGYSGADRVLDRLREARTEAETREAVHALQRTMFDDPPAVFLYWIEGSRAVSRRFTIPAGEGIDILTTVAQWQLADPAATAAPVASALGGVP
jgi:peptide/nickel transport system substrate-binding protein